MGCLLLIVGIMLLGSPAAPIGVVLIIAALLGVGSDVR